MDWQSFFAPGTPVTALPNWNKPRLYLATSRYSSNWRRSSFYPAFRLSAKFYRRFLRFKAMLGMTKIEIANPDYCYIELFLPSSLLPVNTACVLVGNASSSPKYILKLESNSAKVIGYMKYTNSQVELLENEHFLLQNIPKNVAPHVIKYDNFLSGKALLLSSIDGKQIKATLPPPPNVQLFLNKLIVSSSVSTNEHPWIQKLKMQNNSHIDTLLEKLLYRDQWPVAIQHGDLAPWNLISKNSEIKAIDWEYGCLEAFPFIDLIYYCLQVSALIYRWKPRQSTNFLKKYLKHVYGNNLNLEEIESLIKLTVYDIFQRFNINYSKSQDYLNQWRKAIIEL